MPITLKPQQFHTQPISENLHQIAGIYDNLLNQNDPVQYLDTLVADVNNVTRQLKKQHNSDTIQKTPQNFVLLSIYSFFNTKTAIKKLNLSRFHPLMQSALTMEIVPISKITELKTNSLLTPYLEQGVIYVSIRPVESLIQTNVLKVSKTDQLANAFTLNGVFLKTFNLNLLIEAISTPAIISEFQNRNPSNYQLPLFNKTINQFSIKYNIPKNLLLFTAQYLIDAALEQPI